MGWPRSWPWLWTLAKWVGLRAGDVLLLLSPRRHGGGTDDEDSPLANDEFMGALRGSWPLVLKVERAPTAESAPALAPMVEPAESADAEEGGGVPAKALEGRKL